MSSPIYFYQYEQDNENEPDDKIEDDEIRSTMDQMKSNSYSTIPKKKKSKSRGKGSKKRPKLKLDNLIESNKVEVTLKDDSFHSKRTALNGTDLKLKHSKMRTKYDGLIPTENSAFHFHISVIPKDTEKSFVPEKTPSFKGCIGIVMLKNLMFFLLTRHLGRA